MDVINEDEEENAESSGDDKNRKRRRTSSMAPPNISAIQKVDSTSSRRDSLNSSMRNMKSINKIALTQAMGSGQLIDNLSTKNKMDFNKSNEFDRKL